MSIHRKITAWKLCLLLSMGVVACEPGEPGGSATGDSDGITAPKISALSPTQLVAGSEVEILGENFCNPAEGKCRTVVTFEGVYQTSQGSEQVGLVAEDVTYNKETKTLKWVFGPNIPFSSSNQIGVFSGTLRASNQLMTGQGTKGSDPKSVQLTVGPSIIVRQLGALNGNCAGTDSTGTLAAQNLIVEVEAIGLSAGTPQKPLVFGYTMMKSDFSFTGSFKSNYYTDPSEIVPQIGAVGLVHQVTDSTTVSTIGGSTLTNVQFVNQAVGSNTSNTGSALFDEMLGLVPTSVEQQFSVTGIKTKELSNDEANYTQSTINITATDGVNVAHRAVPFKIWAPISLSYDGTYEVVEKFAPQIAQGCVVGKPPWTNVSYTESTTETRQRSISTALVTKPSVAASLRLPGFELNAKIEGEFGINVNETVTSQQLVGENYSWQVFTGEVGVLYRQTVQLERRVRVQERDACGRAIDAGYAVITDWEFRTDLAKSKQATCDPLPESESLFASDSASSF